MPIRKKLTIGDNQGRVIIWPSPTKTRGGLEVRENLEDAKEQAQWESNRYSQYRYVVCVGKIDRIENGYVVVSPSDLMDYFGDLMEDKTVYRCNLS